MNTNDQVAIDEILSYWFSKDAARLGIKDVTTPMELWFSGTSEIDADIERRFLPQIKKAILGDLDHWMNDPRGALALIILLDQFTLNVYRDRPHSFTYNHLALPYALSALERSYDRQVEPLEAVFFYLPLEHAEDIHLQNYAVSLYQDLALRAPVKERELFETFVDYAQRHQRVIDKYGRFPDRNPVLGRPATPEEDEYMKAGGPDF